MARDWSRRRLLIAGGAAVGVAGCAFRKSSTPSGAPGGSTATDSPTRSPRAGTTDASPSPRRREDSDTPPQSPESDGRDWPATGYDRSHTGHPADEQGPERAVEVRWEVEVPQGAFAEPAVADGTVYAGAMDHTVRALATRDGSERWVAEADAPVASTPAVAGGRVYVQHSSDPELGAGVGVVRTLALADGSDRWRFEAGDWTLGASPTVVDDRVYVVAGDEAYALDTSDGSQVWHTSLADLRDDRDLDYDTQADAVTPAIRDGTVYVGDRQLVALDAGTGAERWRAPTGTARPVSVAGGHVYAVRGTSLMAVDASDGTDAWTADLGVVLPSPPAIDGERVYAGGRDRSTATGRNGGRLVALTVEDGTVAWASRTNGDIRWRPTVATERVYLPDGETGAIAAVTASEGSPVWRVETGERGYSTTALVDGTLYAVGGTIQALEP